MRGFAVSLTLAATLAIVVTLFHLKQRVGDLERELSRVNRSIAAHRETVQVLRTEWSFLNQPARIAALAERHLGMRRNAPGQLIGLEDLPPRDASRGRAGGQAGGAASTGRALPALPASTDLAARTRDKGGKQ